MKLSELKIRKADSGAVLKLRHPRTEEVIPGMTLTLLGKDSKVLRAIQLDRTQAALNRMQRRGAVDPVAAEIIDQATDDLVALTIGWEGFTDDGGALMPFSKDAIKKIYNDPELSWIKEQAEKFINDRANFF